MAAKDFLYRSKYGFYKMKPDIREDHKHQKKNQNAANFFPKHISLTLLHTDS